MILWIVLFVLVVAISFILAAKSMKDFREIPANEQYGLFLIRKSQELNAQLLNLIQRDLLVSNSVISFERLFRGGKSALVIYGPKPLLFKYLQNLDLLELEDYTNVNPAQISAWEVGIKGKGQVFENLPEFPQSEQFWWQIIISSSFKIQVRAIVISEDDVKRHSLTQTLHNLAPEKIIKLPKAYSNEQILEFYKTRSFKKDEKNPVLKAEDIIHLLSI